MKVENLQIHINKQPNTIEVTPRGPIAGVSNLTYLIPVKIEGQPKLEGKINFSAKRLKSGLALFEKN